MKNKLRYILSTNIKNKRQFLGYSQAKLAEIANIAPAYIAMIELGKKFPSDNVLERIAKALKIDPTELFSQSCIQVEEIKTIQKSVIDSIELAVKTQISLLKTKK